MTETKETGKLTAGPGPANLVQCLAELERERIAAIQADGKPLRVEVGYYDLERIKADGVDATFNAAYDTLSADLNHGEEDSSASDEKDEAAWLAYEAAMNPFTKYLFSVQEGAGGVRLDTGSFAAHHLKKIDSYDAYGTGRYAPNEAFARLIAEAGYDVREVFLFDTYGDEDLDRHDKMEKEGFIPLYSPCLIYEENGVFVVEIGDIVLTATNGTHVANYHKVLLPGATTFMKFLREGEISGKRAIYYHPEAVPATISFRCSEKAYVSMDALQDPTRPVGNNNLSGTRLIVPLG